MRKKAVYSKESSVWDSETGELLTVSSENVYKLPSEPPFVKLYVDKVCDLVKVKGRHKDFLLELLKYMNYNNEVVLVKSIKDKISKSVGMSVNHINTSITALKKNNILVPCGRAMYYINPDYFAKGNWKDIHELRLIITVGKDGTTFKSEISNLK